MKNYEIKIERSPEGLRLDGNLCVINYKGKIITIDNRSAGCGHSAHPNIDISGSVSGMKKLGYWDKKDTIVKSAGYYYNISKTAISENIDALCLWLQDGNKLPFDKAKNKPFEGIMSFQIDL
jgi:hypothetical protein